MMRGFAPSPSAGTMASCEHVTAADADGTSSAAFITAADVTNNTRERMSSLPITPERSSASVPKCFCEYADYSAFLLPSPLWGGVGGGGREMGHRSAPTA